MGLILAAAGVYGGECAAALSWSAVFSWARDDALLWSRLRLRLFPGTVARAPPAWAGTDRRWLAYLCVSLGGALAEVDDRRSRFLLLDAQKQATARRFRWGALGHTQVSYDDIPGHRDARLALEEAELRLKVIRWGRFRPGLIFRTLTRNVKRPYMRVLTEQEMLARLDALDAELTAADVETSAPV